MFFLAFFFFVNNYDSLAFFLVLLFLASNSQYRRCFLDLTKHRDKKYILIYLVEWAEFWKIDFFFFRGKYLSS